ncbi:MAG: LysR family transcriptional regulator [Enterococcus sp.]
MDIRQIKYFIAVADAKNLSLAAKSLFITQPTLSQTLKKIESELNTPLFSNNNKGFQLTKMGELLYSRGKIIVNDFDSMVEEIQLTSQGKKESLKIGIASLFAIQFMEQISKFIAIHSGIELHFIQDGSIKLQERLAQGAIDIALISFPQYQEDIVIEPLQTTTQGYDVSVVMEKNNPLASRKSVGLIDIKNEKISSLTDNFMLGKLIIERSRSLVFTPDIVFLHDDWDVLIHSLHNLHAVCLLPSDFEKFCYVPDIAWVPLADKNNYYPIGIALRKDFTCTHAMSEFIEAIKQN